MVRDGASRLLTMRPSERGGPAWSRHPQPVIPAKAGIQHFLDDESGLRCAKLSYEPRESYVKASLVSIHPFLKVSLQSASRTLARQTTCRHR